MAATNTHGRLLRKDILRKLMTKQKLIRNVSVIGQLSHGKTSVVQSLLSDSFSVTFKDEEPIRDEHVMTVKAKSFSIIHQLSEGNRVNKDPEDDTYLINVIDTPGHIDFSAEVTTALRITDGAIIVVDCVSGCCVQTENLLKQVIRERNKPVLFLNKLDRLFLEFYLEKEEIYQILRRSIDAANVVMATLKDDSKKSKGMMLDPNNGTVIFGSIFDEWGFSVHDFAEIYANMFKASTAKIRDKLWGATFLTGLPGDGLKPARTLTKGDSTDSYYPPFKNEVDQLIDTLQIKLSPENQAKEGLDLLRVVMQSWLPVANALSRAITVQLPSPVTAQSYKAKHLYEGPNNDSIFHGIVACDSNAPLMMFVSNMISADDEGRFYTFGRVFSGKLVAGHSAKFMGPHWSPTKGKLRMHVLGQPIIMHGDSYEEVESVPAGNICAIIGVDKYLVRSGTISDFEEANVITPMKFSVSPVVQIKVEPMNPEDLPEVLEGLKRLAKYDPLVDYFREESGEHILGVSGEMHMKLCLKDLENKFASAVLKIPDPVVSIRETVSRESTEVCSAKSPNQHNRIFTTAQPLSDDLSLDIENKKISQEADIKVRNTKLKEHYKFDTKDAMNIWCFGPDKTGPNLLIDKTSGVKGLKDIERSVISAFQSITKEGPLCEEPMRGVRFNLCDATLHGDTALRVEGQVTPTALRSLQGAFLTAYPRVQEPVYLCEVYCPMRWLRAAYESVALRRGVIFEEYQVTGTSMYILRANIPIIESFGLDDELQSETDQEVSTQSIFDHWQPMIGNPMDGNNSNAPYELVMSIRRRKGLKDSIPDAADYIDKL